MLCLDIYRDYEADSSATSSAEEVELQAEEEGWKQWEADEEEGSGNLFNSAPHAFTCYLPSYCLYCPKTQKHGTIFLAPGGFSLRILFLQIHF